MAHAVSRSDLLTRRRVAGATACVAVLLFAAGCTPISGLRPAREVASAEDPRTAVAESSGVVLEVTTGAWRGYPSNLERYVMPLLVSIRNGSAHPLRIRYSDLVFRGAALDYQPLPPHELVQRNVELESHETVLVPRFDHSGFRVAGRYVPNFSGVPPWDEPWDFDQPWFERQYLKWEGNLPTVDMIESAVFEGVIEPGGHLEGFLYFEPLQEAGRLAFTANLVDARTELTFGTIRIPFIAGLR